MEDEELLSNTIDLITEIKETEKNIITCILDAKNDFMKKLEYEKILLPYNINLLDEIHANENSHSRILVKLFQYEGIKSDYPILRSFLKSLKLPFSELSLKTPCITFEKDRIDARIRENKAYSIIIENKIHGAGDQVTQIERYIKIETDYGIDEQNIYILYLTSEGGSPDEISISLERRKVFKDRDHYREISFRKEILPWLQDLEIDIKEQKKFVSTDFNILESAINQYVDYLEGKFHIRKGENKMNENMIKLIEDKLELNSKDKTLVKRLQTISIYKDYVKKLESYLVTAEIKLFDSELQSISKQIETTKIDGIKYINLEGKFGSKNSSISFIPESWRDKYCIQLKFNNDSYCELFISIMDKEGTSEPLILKMESIFGKNESPNKEYPYSEWIMENYNYNELLNLITDNKLVNIVKEKIKNIIKKTELLELLK